MLQGEKSLASATFNRMVSNSLSIAHKTGSKRLYDGGDDDYVLIVTMALMVLI